MKPLARQQGCGKGKPLSGIVISCGHHNGDPKPGKTGEHVAEQLHRISGWRAAVVDVPRNEHSVGALNCRQFQKAIRPETLVSVIQQRDPVETFSEVKIRQVYEAHVKQLP